jgi:hypothetical protein
MLTQEAQTRNDETIKLMHQLLKGLTEHLTTKKCKHCRNLLEQILKET